MIQWFDEPVPYLTNTVLTMGNFDGLHLGHQKLLTEVLSRAKTLDAVPVVLTYLEHPGHFVHFFYPVKILTPRYLKQEQIRQLGFEQVHFLNFSSETAHITAEEFLRDVIVAHFKPAVIVSGYDTHFGYQRQGNTDFLIARESTYGYKTLQIPPVYCEDIKSCKDGLVDLPLGSFPKVDNDVTSEDNHIETILQNGTIISSSIIRDLLMQGKVETASHMLGRPYRLYGTVTHGTKMGTIIGFPTINLNLTDPEQLIPGDDIYLTTLMIHGNQYFGLTNIGTSPTLKNSGQIEIETHILDFTSDLYDEEIDLDFLSYLRAEKHFSGAEELVNAIRKDIAQGREIIKNL